MIEISDCQSPSMVLYYNDKNEGDVKKLLQTRQFSNLISVPHNNDITRK